MKQVLFAFVCLLSVPGTALPAAETAKPNIVFILADDIGYGDPRVAVGAQAVPVLGGGAPVRSAGFARRGLRHPVR
jgi:hypothetical protein